MPISLSEHSLYFARNWAGFFILGVTTSLPYAMVTTGAYSIADSMNRTRFLPTIYGAAGSATIIAKVVNAILVNKVHYGWRFLFNSFLLVIGCVLISLSKSFKVAIFGIVFVGAGNAFGENIALGYLSGQGFDDDLVNAWSSGKGFAGLFGSCIYVLAGCIYFTHGEHGATLGYLNEMTFLLITPLVLIYLTAFMKLIIPPFRGSGAMANGPHSPIQTSPPRPTQFMSSEERAPLLATSTETAGSRSFEANRESEELSVLIRGGHFRLWWHRICAALCVVLPLAINLGLSTFLAYTSRVATSKALPRSEYDKGCPEVFAALQLCYQVGVFASQSSLQLVKIRFPYPLTFIQLLCTICWMTNEFWKFLPVYVLPAFMLLVGLLNGATYVNTFYLVQTEDKFGYPVDRELCTNIAAIFINIGISCSCILQTSLDNTVLNGFSGRMLWY